MSLAFFSGMSGCVYPAWRSHRAGISGSIVIDSVLQEAYQGTTLMNDHMNGEFPVLKPGANAISWSGTVTKVVVRPNWRFL